MQRVVFGFLGTTLDAYGGFSERRHKMWRPTISLAQDKTFNISRIELWHNARFQKLAEQIKSDIENLSNSQTTKNIRVVLHQTELANPWNFEEVYSLLYDFANNYSFRPEEEEYFVHLTTGTHVAQICLFLLTESRHFPAKLVQTSPRNERGDGIPTVIDLDLSRYDKISQRFEQKVKDDLQLLKAGINTRNTQFNKLIREIELVARSSTEPILLLGPTGAGKSQLAKQVYILKQSHRRLAGEFVEVNCATLKGEQAMSTLFGHARGAFTGAVTDRSGLLKKADTGLLFLDEIGELGLDEQAMLLRALEEKRFLALGSDNEQTSDFQLIAGTNCDLNKKVQVGKFREDLLQRINIWSFELPALKNRPEDIEPNLEFEALKFEERSGRRITFSSEARENYLKFALSKEATWPGNFRDLNASVVRMSTLAPQGRITEEVVSAELKRLKTSWHQRTTYDKQAAGINIDYELFKKANINAHDLDLFDLYQLNYVLQVLANSRSLAEAGRTLFAVSRQNKSTANSNDSDRLRKYLTRYKIKPRVVLGAAV